MKHTHHTTILLAGGGTAGPVVPLLAVSEYIKIEHPRINFVLVGTKNGPERILATKQKLPFFTITSAKFKRHTIWGNILLPFQLLAGFVQSIFLLRRIRPQLVFGAGGFVQVPVAYAAWLLRIPVAIHQQDVVPSLANVLVAPIATLITTSFEKSIRDFSRGITLQDLRTAGKITWTGNPYRYSLKEVKKESLQKKLRLESHKKTILFMGGGTGAEALNVIVWENLSVLTREGQIIHLTGKGKYREVSSPHYYQFEFFDDMASLYAISDVVVCRAGLSTITEVAALKKPALIVPIPHSHQEANAAWCESAGAAVVIPQEHLSGSVLLQALHNLLYNEQFRSSIVKNLSTLLPTHSTARVAKLVLALAEKNHHDSY